MEKIRLLLADDHNILRQGLIDIIENYSDICVVGEAEDGQGMLNKYFDLLPDVVLCDIEMPRVSGLEAAEKILKRDKNAKIIFLTMYNTDEFIYKAVKTGVTGFITKDVIKSELINAIRSVGKGEKYFMGRSAEDIQTIIDRYENINTKKNDSRSIILTGTEKKILLYIAQGKTSEQIADELNKAKRTIDSLRSSIMSKLNLKSLPQLIRYAMQYESSHKEKD